MFTVLRALFIGNEAEMCKHMQYGKRRSEVYKCLTVSLLWWHVIIIYLPDQYMLTDTTDIDTM